MSRALIDLQGVSKTFVQGSQTVYALRDVDLTLGAGELHVVYGRSGSGKTTLLNVVGGLELPDEGSVHVAGEDMTALDDEGRVALRREKLAFVFQAFGLLPILSAEENVEVPLRLRRAEPHGAPRPGQGAARSGGPLRPGSASAGGAVGRRAAAGGDRKGACQPTDGPRRR